MSQSAQERTSLMRDAQCQEEELHVHAASLQMGQAAMGDWDTHPVFSYNLTLRGPRPPRPPRLHRRGPRETP